MAHTKAKGTSKLGRDSLSKRLGIKISGGQKVNPGQIIVRQRGTKFYCGRGVASGADDTIYAKKQGQVYYITRKIRKFTGKLIQKKFVEVH